MCTVIVDGEAVKSCLMPGLQARRLGRSRPSSRLAEDDELNALQRLQ